MVVKLKYIARSPSCCLPFYWSYSNNF